MDVHDWVVLPLVAIHLLHRVKPETAQCLNHFPFLLLLLLQNLYYSALGVRNDLVNCNELITGIITVS